MARRCAGVDYHGRQRHAGLHQRHRHEHLHRADHQQHAGARATSPSNVVLANPPPPASCRRPATQTVTIMDNNSGLSFSSPTYTVLKTSDRDHHGVPHRQHQHQFLRQFATTDGTAVAGTDYVATSGIADLHQRRGQPDLRRERDCQHHGAAGQDGAAAIVQPNERHC